MTPQNEGTACDDGDVCNIGETCQSGTCTGGSAADCASLDTFCADYECDPAGAEGNCDVMTPQNEGTACDDGDVCNIGETCQSGTCTGGSAADCASLDTFCADYECDPAGAEGNCDVMTPQNEGTACDDGDVCNIGETCQSGTCTGGSAPDCSAAGDQCNDASCDPAGAEGNCDTITPVADGTDCDDDKFCTETDTCQGGICVGTGDPCAPLVCDEVEDVCIPECTNDDQCDRGDCSNDWCEAGICYHNLVAAGTECRAAVDDCDVAEECDGSSNVCPADGYQPDNTPCNDGNACTQTDTCQGGVCEGFNPVICTPLDQCHDAGICDPGTGVCSDPAKPDDTPCDDGDVCNIGETCQSGTCTGGSAPDCSAAGDQCNDASCDPAGTEGNCDLLTPVEDGTACDDGAFCTSTDTCQSGVCVGTGNPCEPLVCDEANDVCIECRTGGDCDDGNVCTDDICEDGTCIYPTNEAECDDGDACTQGDHCQDGECVGEPISCEDENCVRSTTAPAASAGMIRCSVRQVSTAIRPPASASVIIRRRHHRLVPMRTATASATWTTTAHRFPTPARKMSIKTASAMSVTTVPKRPTPTRTMRMATASATPAITAPT